MIKQLLSLALFIIPLFAIAESEDCSKQKYTGDINKIVDIKFSKSEYLSTLDEYIFDTHVLITPVKQIDGLQFYGGALQHGVPIELHTIIDFKDYEGTKKAWFYVNKKKFSTTKLFLWYSNEQCHMSVSFMLNEHNKSINVNAPAAPDERTARPL